MLRIFIITLLLLLPQIVIAEQFVRAGRTQIEMLQPQDMKALNSSVVFMNEEDNAYISLSILVGNQTFKEYAQMLGMALVNFEQLDSGEIFYTKQKQITYLLRNQKDVFNSIIRIIDVPNNNFRFIIKGTYPDSQKYKYRTKIERSIKSARITTRDIAMDKEYILSNFPFTFSDKGIKKLKFVKNVSPFETRVLFAENGTLLQESKGETFVEIKYKDGSLFKESGMTLKDVAEFIAYSRIQNIMIETDDTADKEDEFSHIINGRNAYTLIFKSKNGDKKIHTTTIEGDELNLYFTVFSSPEKYNDFASDIKYLLNSLNFRK